MINKGVSRFPVLYLFSVRLQISFHWPSRSRIWDDLSGKLRISVLVLDISRIYLDPRTVRFPF